MKIPAFALALGLVVVAPLSAVTTAALPMTLAAAADAPATVSFTSPATDGMTVTSPVTLSGTVGRPQGIVDSVDITVRWTDTVNRPPAPHPAQQATMVPPTRSPNYTWSYTPDPAANGRYSVTVVATTHSSSSPTQSQTTASRSFFLDVKPAVPTNVKTTVDPGPRTARVTWAANTEPDLIGYAVMRAGPKATDVAKVVGGVDVPQTDFIDTDVAVQPVGTYRYSVVAVRQNADGTKPDLSDPSPETNATFDTPPKASAPPPSPSTTQAGGRAGSPGTAPAGSRSGTAPAAAGGGALFALPPAGRNSLAEYQNLVGEARAATVTTEPPDPGFQAKLPFAPKTTTEIITTPGTAEAAPLGAPDVKGNGVQKTFEFVAAALVLGVLALFGLLLTRTAKQTAALDALVPEVVPAEAPVAVAPAHGPSLMLTLVSPAKAAPTPVER